MYRLILPLVLVFEFTTLSFPVHARQLEHLVRILVVGDSLANGFAGAISSVVSTNDFNTRHAIVEKLVFPGTGLIPRNRQDYLIELENRLQQINSPVDIVIISLGINDVGMPLGPGPFYGEEWKHYYRKRMISLINLTLSRHILTFWIGFPIIRNDTFTKTVETVIQPLQEETLRNLDTDVHLIPIRDLTTVDGQFVPFRDLGNGRAHPFRQTDGIHFSGEGYRYLAEHIVTAIEQAAKLRLRPESKRR
jgi:hypothetical protein